MTIPKLSIKDKLVHTVMLTMNEEKVFIKINKQNIMFTLVSPNMVSLHSP